MESEENGVRRGAEAKEVVVDGVRAAILSGELSPGQRLVEAELTELFAVTRGSVRSAFADLTAEGLVERIPNRGVRVRRVSVEEAVEILECRGVLEGLIAARAAMRVNDAQAEQLRQIGDGMQAAVASGDVLTYSRLNSQLHATVSEIGAQPVAADLITRLRSQIVRHQFQLSLRPGRPQVSLPEHLAIIEGVLAHDAARAEQAARRHVESVIAALQQGAEAPGTLVQAAAD
ncbi:GntR family transcriptional regulator [Tersicoccus sp. Bi-70]|uniref:GntR family transcriptional regulator n=1 Tax=Tersicoccus sp. Bi-70 TaxID=1897634 RepID=UPI0009766EE2|nr:GntR family transcriptional regulator [Tersicoccus sp. Bi-70]OMH35022.1 GntR family transcriptional regulator [Tersicoccus sp. Bi-70]